MSQIKLETYAKNTWCPGCGNFAILNAIKMALVELNAEGVPLENIVLVSGIGCHAKIVDYLNVNSFYSLHGRGVPVAEGIKLSNPNVKVIGFAGDGDDVGEGVACHGADGDAVNGDVVDLVTADGGDGVTLASAAVHRGDP